MPAVSEKQRRAMHAAEEGRSTLGIPKSVAREFLTHDSEARHCASVMLVSPDGDILLMRRPTDEQDAPSTWDLPGGNGEPGETPEAVAMRETLEETGIELDPSELRLVSRSQTRTGKTHSLYAQPVESQHRPNISSEHAGWCWAPIDQLPQPLRPELARTLAATLRWSDAADEQERQAIRLGFADWVRDAAPEVVAQDTMSDGIALDRATVRRIDEDGHMHIARTPISKANICPYYGREIPNWQGLGLQPDKTYRLFRHPEELARAARTFAGKPLLLDHTPVSADDHPDKDVVGTVGNEVVWEAPYLTAPLSIWSRKGVRGVQSGSHRELSSAYRYRADMTPGEWQGEAYDGVMRDISGNHVALVREGRAGPDVVVHDSSPMSRALAPTETHMFEKALAQDEWSDEARRKAAETRKRNAKGGASASSGGSREPDYKSAPKGRVSGTREGSGIKGNTAEAKKDKMFRNETGAQKYLAGLSKEERASVEVKKIAGGGVLVRPKRAQAQDSRHHKEHTMKIKTTRGGALVHGALAAYLAPKLAMDASVDLTPAVAGNPLDGYDAWSSGVEAKVARISRGKLAQDANLDDLPKMLSALRAQALALDSDEDDDKAEDDEHDDKAKDSEEDDKKAEDDEHDDDKAKDNETEAEKRDNESEAMRIKARERREKAEDTEHRNNGITKPAMDAAIRRAERNTEARVMKTFRDIRAAEEAVRPYVGKLAMDHSTADDVYRDALSVLGVDGADTMHPDALRHVLAAQPLPGSGRTHAANQPSMATDAAAAKSFTDMFPNYRQAGSV